MLKALLLSLLLSIPAFSQSQRTFTANATDVTAVVGDTECGVAYVQFYINGSAVGPQIQPPATGTQYTYVWDSKTVPNGTYTLTAKAADKAGLNGACDSTAQNVGTSSPITFTVNNIPNDTSAPTITISPPLVGTITLKSQPIQVAAADDTPIKKITLKVNGVLKASSTNLNTLGFVWNTSPYKGTSALVEIAATDSMGNTRTVTSSVFVKK